MFKPEIRNANKNEQPLSERSPNYQKIYQPDVIDKSVDVFNPDLLTTLNKKPKRYTPPAQSHGTPVDRTVYVFDPVTVNTRKPQFRNNIQRSPMYYNETIATFPIKEVHGININATHYVPAIVEPDVIVTTKPIAVHNTKAFKPIVKIETLRNTTVPIDGTAPNIGKGINPVQVETGKRTTTPTIIKKHKRPGPTSSEETDVAPPQNNDDVDTFEDNPPKAKPKQSTDEFPLEPQGKRTYNKQKPNNVDIRYGYNFSDGSKVILEFVKVLNNEIPNSQEDMNNNFALNAARNIFNNQQHSIEKDLLNRIGGGKKITHKNYNSPIRK